jgi:hypothetical protein
MFWLFFVQFLNMQGRILIDALSLDYASLILAIMIITKVVETNSKLKLDSNSCEALVFFPV